jgi:hypothetical protein
MISILEKLINLTDPAYLYTSLRGESIWTIQAFKDSRKFQMEYDNMAY